MGAVSVELGVPYTGWPVRSGADYEFGLDRLSSELIAEIEAWAREFNAQFDDERGWTSPVAELMHLREGRELVDKLRGELGDGFSVKLITL